MQNLIKTSLYLIASLWMLGCLPSYAAEKTATYYTFVMYKAPYAQQWEIPSNPKAIPGSYRFQIVYMNPYENRAVEWLALRGEFEFVKDPAGGVKLAKKYTLDEHTADANNSEPNRAFSLWSINSWEEKGRKWVQPLIAEMNRILTKADSGGSPDPNFIRFLIRQKKVEDNWTDNDKKYHIYRLHFFKNHKPNHQIEIISRFIAPNNKPATDIDTLIKWLNQQKNGFTSAFYLGKPDLKHEEFFQDFKNFFYKNFNLTQPVQPSSSTTETNNQNKVITDNTDWTSIILAILVVLIVVIIVIALYFEDLKKLLQQSKKDDDGNSQEKRDQDNRESAFNNVSKNEFNKLKKDLQQEIRNELITAKNDLQTNSYNTQATPEIDNNKLSLLVEMAVKKYLDKNLGSYLNLHLKGYKNQTTSAKKNQQAVKTSSDNRNYTQKDIPPTIPKQLKKPTDNTIIQIKTLLLSNKSVDDEAALNSLNTNVDPCIFITSVVGNCLKLNQPLTHYQRLNGAIKELTNNKISLLIPSVGDNINPKEHNVVGQQTVSKGKLNVVASLIRPGVKCDGVIKRKAEVVQNV